MPRLPWRSGALATGTLLGAMAAVCLLAVVRACAHVVHAEVLELGAPFDSLSPSARAGILRLRRIDPRALER